MVRVTEPVILKTNVLVVRSTDTTSPAIGLTEVIPPVPGEAPDKGRVPAKVVGVGELGELTGGGETTLGAEPPPPLLE